MGSSAQQEPVLGPAVRFALIFLVITGLAYPLVITGIARALFPHQAQGSLVMRGGQVIGSALIGQPFRRPDYFWSRLDPAGAPSNLGPSDAALTDRVQAEIANWRVTNPGQEPPADLLTRSGSGLDPDITPAAARAQVPRISKARGLSVEELERLIERETKGRLFGLFGEPRVNVLRLNLALDALR
jgi:K+-transporting ATPase ATPase C chain